MCGLKLLLVANVTMMSTTLVEDRETYLMKTRDQIAEGDYELAKGKEKTILTRLHRKLMNQLKSMGIEDFKEQQKYMVTGPVMASMALLIKVHKKNFPGRAYVSQIDDPSYKICKELTDILNPLDEEGCLAYETRTISRRQ